MNIQSCNELTADHDPTLAKICVYVQKILRPVDPSIYSLMDGGEQHVVDRGCVAMKTPDVLVALNPRIFLIQVSI